MRKTSLPIKLTGLLLCILCLGSFTSDTLAQTIDRRFRMPVALSRAQVQYMATQPDGKILVNGYSNFYSGSKQIGTLVRLTPSGSIDRTFNSQFNGYIHDIKPYKDGGYLLRHYSNLYLLSAKGEVSYAGINCNDFVVLPDYSIVVSYGNYIRKFTQPYAYDYSFGDRYVNGEVYDMAVQKDKIVLVGDFSSVSYYSANNIARISFQGDFDTNFNTGSGSDEYIETVTVLADNKILLSNTEMEEFDENSVYGLARLNEDGSFDDTFNLPYLYESGPALVNKSGSIFVYSSNHEGVVKLTLNGEYDENYEMIYPNDEDQFVLLNTGELLLSNASWYSQTGFAKFGSAGQQGTFTTTLAHPGDIYSIVHVKNSNDFLISGNFYKLNNAVAKGSALINASTGQLNPFFKYGSSMGNINDAIKTDDRGIIVSANWTGFVKLDSKGAQDPSFSWGSTYPHYYWFPQKLQLTEEGKILTADYAGVARYNSDGSFDYSFNYGYNNYWSYAPSLQVQDDGKILYASYFTWYDGQSARNMFRLNSDGSRDGSFNVGNGPNSVVLRMGLNSTNNDLYIGGYFNYFNGYYAQYFAKLNSDGSFDHNFMTKLSESGFYNGDYNRPFLPFRDGFVIYNYGYDNGAWQPRFYHNDGSQSTLDLNQFADYRIGWVNDIRVLNDNSIYLLGNLTGPMGQTQMLKINMPATTAPVVTSNSNNTRVASLQAYPNPSRDFITIDTKGATRVTILSMDGQVKISKNISGSNDKINVQDLPRGRYILQTIEDGKTKRSHFIKE